MRALRLELELFRYRPDLELDGTWEAYAVECEEHATLLDVLRQVQAEIDPGIAFRWDCRSGVCGGCGLAVNDAPVLACTTRVAELAQPVRVAPLANFPVIRDLVVDVEPFEAGLRSFPSWAGDDAAARRSVEDAARDEVLAECAVWAVQLGLSRRPARRSLRGPGRAGARLAARAAA